VNGQARESAKGHQPANFRGPQGQRRNADGVREETGQQGTERGFEEHLSQEAQREGTGAGAGAAKAVSFLHPLKQERRSGHHRGASFFCVVSGQSSVFSEEGRAARGSLVAGDSSDR